MQTNNFEITGWRRPVIGAQMLFVAFGSLVLVPMLTGLSSNVALFTAGIGTLLFQLVTKRQVPIFLASSFAFIAPISYGVATFGIPSMLSGLVASGFVFMGISALIAWRGPSIIKRVLPPIVTGPVIMVIGLNLAPVAINMALGKSGDGSSQLFPLHEALPVAMIALFATMTASIWGKGVTKLIPVFMGIVCGYIAAYAFGIVDFTAIIAAKWFSIPDFVTPEFNWQAILFMLPVAIAPAVEHIGDVAAISSVTGKNYMEKPGVHRTMLGDGIATSVAGFLGGPPCTTYSEVTGAVALTKAFDPRIMTWAALTAITLSFVGKLGAALATIPTPVMGGIMIILFGAIASVGIHTLVRDNTDLTAPRNMMITSITIVFGVGGMVFNIGEFALQGIGLSAIVAIALNLILPAHLAESEAK